MCHHATLLLHSKCIALGVDRNFPCYSHTLQYSSSVNLWNTCMVYKSKWLLLMAEQIVKWSLKKGGLFEFLSSIGLQGFPSIIEVKAVDFWKDCKLDFVEGWSLLRYRSWYSDPSGKTTLSEKTIFQFLNSTGLQANWTFLEWPPVGKDHFSLTSRMVIPDRFHCTRIPIVRCRCNMTPNWPSRPTAIPTPTNQSLTQWPTHIWNYGNTCKLVGFMVL